MKLLHTGDWHLREKDIEECEQCLAFLVATARKENVGLVAIAGDVFDSQDVKLDSHSARLAVQTVSALADIAPVVIVIGTPSHDGKAPEILRYARGRYDIEVATAPKQIILLHGDLCREPIGGRCDVTPEATITLIPQPTKQFFQTSSGIAESDKEIGAAMTVIFAGFGAAAQKHDEAPHILVGHWNVSGSSLSNGQVLIGLDIEVSVDQMMMAVPGLICLGHIHKSQKLGNCAFYSGSLYHQSWGEMEEKGFWIHEINKDIIVGSEFVQTPTKKLARFTHDFTNGAIPEQISDDAVAGAYVRLDYKVWQDEAGTIDKEAISERMKEAGALDVDIRIIRVPRHNVRSEAVLKTERLREKIQKMAELKGEEIALTVLTKAEILEERAPDELIEAVGRAYA